MITILELVGIEHNLKALNPFVLEISSKNYFDTHRTVQKSENSDLVENGHDGCQSRGFEIR